MSRVSFIDNVACESVLATSRLTLIGISSEIERIIKDSEDKEDIDILLKQLNNEIDKTVQFYFWANQDHIE